jgi:hypothetical protein
LIARFIDEQRAVGRGVESICAVLQEQGVQVAPRTYRSWRTNPPAVRALSDAAILDRLRTARTGGIEGGPLPEVLYGRRKMTRWLQRTGFAEVSKHTVDRLMRDEGMRGLVRGRKTRTTVGGKDGVRAGDLLNRRFRTTAPNRAWVTDFTYVPTWSGFAYVAFVIDLYSRAIVGWSASNTKDVAFVEAGLSMALWRRDHTGRPVPEGMIHHSDAGSQGGFNRSSQHLVITEVFGGHSAHGDDDRVRGGPGWLSAAVGGGSGVAATDAFTGAAGAVSCGAASVLASDRVGGDDGRGRGGCWCVMAGRGALVPSRWRDAAGQPGRAFEPVLVVRRTRGDRAAACSRGGRARDRPPDRTRPGNRFEGDSSQRGDQERQAGLPRSGGAVEGTAGRETSEDGDARQQRQVA